jgi:mannose-6-phosphate isomerase
MEHHGRELFGRELPAAFRFPWLAKILDAREDLSLQVHPPAEIAPQMRGEPKTEIWYIAAAEPGACLYVGLRQGATREEFERRIADGTVAECFHRVAVKVGDVMFLPSGRVHALGGGIVLFEIQQNSDTTYRVFDWNRVGLDGRPRELHIAQSLASIDFSDIEPSLAPDRFTPLTVGVEIRALAEHPAFKIVLHRYQAGAHLTFAPGKLRLVASVDGTFRLSAAGREVDLSAGGFGLIPAAVECVCSTTVGGQLIVVEESSAA